MSAFCILGRGSHRHALTLSARRRFVLAIGAAAQSWAQVFVTSVTASFPDPNGKLPGFNLVSGAGIANWSIGLAQAALTQGQYYNYCVSLGTGTATGKAAVAYKIARGSTIIQSQTIITAKNFSVGNDGVWYLCSGYAKLPSSPGAATLTGTVTYTATGTTKPVVSKLSVPILLQ